MEKLNAIILMAGLSTRFDGANKQLSLLNNKPVFSYALDTFVSHKNIGKVVAVVNQSNKFEIEKYITESNYNVEVVLGGNTRQESVENALKTLNLQSKDIVIIHDGARPLINHEIIDDVADAALKYGAATTYINVADTIAVKNENDEILRYENRANLVQIQTPQAFAFDVIKNAHNKNLSDTITDDCSLVLANGNKVKLVKGDKKLHKITTKEDLVYLEGLLK